MQRVVPVETFALFWGKGPKQYPRYGNRMTQVHKDPNILTIDNFLTSADINDLHKQIRGRRFLRSSMKDSIIIHGDTEKDDRVILTGNGVNNTNVKKFSLADNNTE
jgi:hypothetical protein